MNKRTMIQHYRQFSASKQYAIGFVYQGGLYVAYMNEIAPRYMKVEKASHKNGGGNKLQLRLNNKHKEQLIRKGAEYIGQADIVEKGQYNRGVEFERLIYAKHNQVFRGKDSVGFWVSGDIDIDGIPTQIKLDTAQIVMESTLKNLQKKFKGICH